MAKSDSKCFSELADSDFQTPFSDKARQQQWQQRLPQRVLELNPLAKTILFVWFCMLCTTGITFCNNFDQREIVSKLAIENPKFIRIYRKWFPLTKLLQHGGFLWICIAMFVRPSRCESKCFEQDPKGEKPEKSTEVSNQRGWNNFCR